jgi:hypothetical protein
VWIFKDSANDARPKLGEVLLHAVHLAQTVGARVGQKVHVMIVIYFFRSPLSAGLPLQPPATGPLWRLIEIYCRVWADHPPS